MGIRAIPEKWIKQLENSVKIEKIAMDMHKIFVEGQEVPYDEYLWY